MDVEPRTEFLQGGNMEIVFLNENKFCVFEYTFKNFSFLLKNVKTIQWDPYDLISNNVAFPVLWNINKNYKKKSSP